MKSEKETQEFLAKMAERDKISKKQFDEEVRKKFPPGIEFPQTIRQPEPGHVNCRCTIIPCTERKEAPK